MELAPFNVVKTFQVAKASLGHFPLPFLISESQRTGAKLEAEFESAKSFLRKTLIPGMLVFSRATKKWNFDFNKSPLQ